MSISYSTLVYSQNTIHNGSYTIAVLYH